MATFIIFYSDVYEAKARHWPLQGSTVEIDTLEDIDTFVNQLGASKVIIRHMSDYTFPYWAEYTDTNVYAENHEVDRLPDGWKTMRWIEVYNGRRE